MSGLPRPALTPSQHRAAVAALEEMRVIYDGYLNLRAAALSLVEIMDAYNVPLPAALPSAGAFASTEDLARGMDAMADYIERARIVQPEYPSRPAGVSPAGADALAPAGELRTAA